MQKGLKLAMERKLTTIIILTISFLFSAPLALSHPGGLDAHGGHTNRTTEEYHCHKAPCTEAHRQSEAALREAKEEGRAFSYIYNREDWKHWSDPDNDCMNTRHEVLNDQAEKGSVKLSPDGCYVSRGKWLDPFSGKILTRASDLDVDHIIPLKWAHEHGGANWSKSKKEQFANDPKNLLAVDDGLNQQKGAKGPSEWMPPNHDYRCEYLYRWKTVLDEYDDLKMRSGEKRVFERQLGACG